MQNLLAELKRRQMFRVAAAYAVVAWLLLQIFNNVAPILEFPPWVGRVLLLLLVIGFPVTLLAIWMQQLAPADSAARQAATTKLDVTLIGALVAVIGIFLYQQLVPQATVAPRDSPAQGASLAIAVLPFANLSGDAGQDDFSDGMTEEIGAVLAKVQGLTVLARSSAFQFKGQNTDPRDVGRALNATHLIEGSVRKAGERVRITAQLVRADNAAQLWSETYDRQLTDIFAIQEEIARAITASLSVRLELKQGETLVRDRTASADSYEQYLRAKALVRARGTGGLRVITEATALLEQVVARDPEYAPAWALLTQAYALTPVFDPALDIVTEDEYRRFSDPFRQKAETAAQRALQLAPNQADGYVALAAVSRDYVVGEDLHSKALTLDPNNPDGLESYSYRLESVGRVKEALATRKKLYALEPFVPRFNQFLADTLWLNGQDDAAIALINDLGGTRPHQLAMIHAAAGRFSEAADALSTIPPETYRPGQLESAIRILRTAPAAVATPQSLPSLGPLGFVYLHVGAPDRVLDPADRSIAPRLLWHPSYAPVRKTERFKAMMRNEGLVDYWKQKGWPELCRPVGADDFVCD